MDHWGTKPTRISILACSHWDGLELRVRNNWLLQLCDKEESIFPGSFFATQSFAEAA